MSENVPVDELKAGAGHENVPGLETGKFEKLNVFFEISSIFETAKPYDLRLCPRRWVGRSEPSYARLGGGSSSVPSNGDIQRKFPAPKFSFAHYGTNDYH